MSVLNQIAFVVQGPSTFVEKVKESLSNNSVGLIFSTWKGEETNYSLQDTVVLSEKPSNTGIHNLNLQKISTINGLKKAKELGYKYAIKWRSDMISSNISNLLSVISFFEKDLNFLFWVNHMKGYFCDYFIAGTVDNLINLWSFPEKNYSYPEQAITENYFENLSHLNVKFVGNQLSESNNIAWLKNNINLDTYKNQICFSDKLPS